MSIANIDLIMRRIMTTERDSPLAVFLIRNTIPNGETDQHFLDCVFANTVNTQARLRECDPDLVGVFHRDHNPTHVLQRLLSFSGRA